MLWLILSWGLVAAICYFALNHLGGNGEPSGQAQQQNETSQSTPANSNSSSNCDWTNDILTWMYNNFHKVPGPLDAWIRGLNDAAKKATTPTKCEVLFEGFGDHSTVKNSPKISNIRVEPGPKDHLTVRLHVHLPCIKLKLVSSQRTSDRLLISNLDASINDLRGEVQCRMASIGNQLRLMCCFNGRPEMDIELYNQDPNAQQQVSFGMVEEGIRRCILSAVTTINLSETATGGDYYYGSDDAAFVESFNRAMSQPIGNQYSPYMTSSTEAPAVHRLSAGYEPTANQYRQQSFETPFGQPRSASPSQIPDMMKKMNETRLIAPAMNPNSVPNKLRVKVIKASKLGKGSRATDVQQPYVVIEMDEPEQKFTSSKGINANPYWEETYDFDLTPASEEILFEVYEGNAKIPNDDDRNFLGLSIVNFEEIRRSGEPIHALKLQGRPHRKDDVSGDLTCQFDFYYDPTAIAPGKIVDSKKVKVQNGTEFRETVTTQRRVVYDPHDNFESTDITPTKTTTMIVKTVSQQLKEKPVIQSVHGSMENAVDPATQLILDEQFKNDEKMRLLESKLQQAAANNENRTSFVDDPKDRIFLNDTVNEDERRGRDRSKKPPPTGEKRERSFFGELKDRLSGRKNRLSKRSKSVDVNGPEVEEAVSLPPSRDPSRTRYAVPIGDTGTRYRETQSVGARSGESSKSLYQHSTLVLELEQDKQQKYFLIPPSMLTEPSAARLMRRGKKLHIYNEHTFVAVKIKGGASCNVCQQRIKASFAKQAYQCRDCKMVCHKSCHYKTDAFCTQSTVSKLQIAKDIDWAHFLSHYQLEEFISLEGV